MTKEELLMILKYAEDNNISSTKSAEKLGYCRDLYYYKKKYGIPYSKHNIEVNKELILNIVNEALENKIPYKRVCEKYNISSGTFNKYKRLYNIQIDKNINYTSCQVRKYNVNDYFFDDLNELNCYYGGFIAADGYLPTKEKGIVKLELAAKDRQVLEEYKNNLNIESPISERICKKIFKMNGVSFTSYRIREKLYEHFNITSNKSLTLEPPSINEQKLKYAFIRGYIDGDGSIMISGNYLHISILGTKKMCEWIKDTFKEITNNRGSIVPKPNTRIYRISYIAKAAREIFKILYELDVPKLERKWKKEIYDYCINFVKGHNHTYKNVNVFDLYGNLLKRCKSIIEAAEYTKCNKSNISKLVIKGDNRHQSNGYMFSRAEKMEKFIPIENPKFYNGPWKKIRQKLIDEGKIKSEDFPFNIK